VIGSVTDVDEQQRNISQATGFSFYNTEVSDATMALRDALNYLVRANLFSLWLSGSQVQLIFCSIPYSLVWFMSSKLMQTVTNTRLPLAHGILSEV